MRFYKVYLLDRSDQIRDTRLVEAHDDASALKKAVAARRRDEAIEVWDRARFIGRIDAKATGKITSIVADAA